MFHVKHLPPFSENIFIQKNVSRETFLDRIDYGNTKKKVL